MIAGVTYRYDALGDRIERAVSGTSPSVTRFAYDGDDLWADVSTANAPIARYLRGDAVDQVFAREDAQQVARWYLTDRLGSIVDLLKPDGSADGRLRYDGFGAVTASYGSTTDRYRYTGREFDAVTNQQYHRRRYYDVTSRRWTSEDPIGFDAEDVNYYRYVHNGPTNATDPSGLAEEPAANVMGAIVDQVAVSDYDEQDLASAYIEKYGEKAVIDVEALAHLNIVVEIENESWWSAWSNSSYDPLECRGKIVIQQRGDVDYAVEELRKRAQDAVGDLSQRGIPLVESRYLEFKDVIGPAVSIEEIKKMTRERQAWVGYLYNSTYTAGKQIAAGQAGNVAQSNALGAGVFLAFKWGQKLLEVTGKGFAKAGESFKKVYPSRRKGGKNIGKSGIAQTRTLVAPRGAVGRYADLPMDLRGVGLVQGSSRFNKLESFLSDRYGARVSFDNTASFGRIDELTGTIHLNPGTATFDVLAHELSHVRFAQAMSKWGTGGRLTNFEVNLMESIGYHGTYRKGIASGLSHADALANSSFGPAFAQQAIQALRSGSHAVQGSLQRAIPVFGRDYVEQSLRFQGLGIGPGKALPGL